VPTPQSSGEAAQAWAAAKNTTSPAVLESFIRRYGDSFYADIARARLEELKKSHSSAADNGWGDRDDNAVLVGQYDYAATGQL
jgi:hypothetical protein